MAGAAAPVAWAELSSITLFSCYYSYFFRSFLFFYFGGKSIKISFFVLFFFVVLLVSDVCLRALTAAVPVVVVAGSATSRCRKQTHSTHIHTEAVCVRVCVCVFVCVRFTFSLLCCYSHWHIYWSWQWNENWTELKNLLAFFTESSLSHLSHLGSYVKDLALSSYPLWTFARRQLGDGTRHFKQHKQEEDRKFQLTERSTALPTWHHTISTFISFSFFELLLSSFGCQPARRCTPFDFFCFDYYVFSLHSRRN